MFRVLLLSMMVFSACTLPLPAQDGPLSEQHKPSEPSDGFQWKSALKQSGILLGTVHVANIGNYRVPGGDFFPRYFESVGRVRLGTWGDGDSDRINYLGHPAMGAVAGFIQVQNDPTGRAQAFGSPGYWKSRARATAWAAAFAAQWEIGPVSEASLGNYGISSWRKHNGDMTNGTGAVDFVMTPVGGAVWILTEDAIDEYVVRRLDRVSGNRAWRLGVSLLNPARSAANLLRLKAPWYRDRPR